MGTKYASQGKNFCVANGAELDSYQNKPSEQASVGSVHMRKLWLHVRTILALVLHLPICSSLLGAIGFEKWGQPKSIWNWELCGLVFPYLEKTGCGEKTDFVMTLWGIWHSRNKRVWNNTSPSANWTITHAFDTLKEWLAVRMADPQLNKHQNLRSNVLWRNPSGNFFKCNVDGI